MPPEDLPEALRVEARSAGLTLSPHQVEQLRRYIDSIGRWRTRARLTAIADPFAAARLHVADSLLALRSTIPEGASVVDVGSGAGLPGIPLAVARPDLSVTLLEPDARRAAFLEVVSRELELQAVVVRSRAEEAGRDPALRETFDIAVARAVAPLRILCEFTLPLIRPGGKAVLLKGPAAVAELHQAAHAVQVLGGGAVQKIEARLRDGERRVIVVIAKVTSTPPEYPRRPGVPRRRPL